ncbi:MAG TPA: tetratricopeptide repeat protein [Rhizomicrobium sp.]|jgi:tetratricopeptide (TPR) repeat protein
MTIAPLRATLAQLVALASQRMQAGDMAGAEQVLAPLFSGGTSREPLALNVAGLIRLNQARFDEAVALFSQARALAPREPILPFNLGRALSALGRPTEAAESFRAALKLKPDFADAFFELGTLLHQQRQLDEAAKTLRQLLRVMPAHAPAKLALGAVLLDAGYPEEAETPLQRGVREAQDPRLKARLHGQLGLALRRQRKDDEALAQYDSALALDPNMPELALHRAESLQNLQRHDEALAVFKAALAREPRNVGLHHHYNDLLYRLGRKDDYLKSYDRAPDSQALQMDKAFFLSHEKRGAESLEIYQRLLGRDPNDSAAAIGAANALTMTKRYSEASAAFDALLARHGGDADLYSCAAEPAILGGDPKRALALCEQGLRLSPHDQGCLASLSVSYRMMDDVRDETLNGYDTLIRSFDLEPPPGFCDMESFNAELNASLDRLHPETREFVNQSLRGGTQTPDHLFGTGQVLVEKLQLRIDEAVARYIAEMKDDDTHPFLSRRARQFRYTGSWSSRLRDCGFHVNHIHPEGWISSCYYIAAPNAVKDEARRQGWIKFGESSFDVALKNPIRRAVQPAPGRLVLFPSYMWHGTVPFHDTAARTTIAFDAVPSR